MSVGLPPPPAAGTAQEISHREAVDRLVGSPYQFAPHVIEQRRHVSRLVLARAFVFKALIAVLRHASAL